VRVVIRDLDETIRELLRTRAPTGSELAGATVHFDVPDAQWRGTLDGLAVNCYLYDTRENRDLRTTEMLLQRSVDRRYAIHRRPPVRIDCAYCITAWSSATAESVLDEHRLLGHVLKVLLKNPSIPSDVLQGSLATQIPPYPTVIASTEGIKNQPDFWRALDQQLKPSLNYVVTLALMLDEPPAELLPVVDDLVVGTAHLDELPG
jgi:hypothetical protein